MPSVYQAANGRSFDWFSWEACKGATHPSNVFESELGTLADPILRLAPEESECVAGRLSDSSKLVRTA